MKKFKVFNVEFDGIDKVGKDTVLKQIFSYAPNKYIPKARGLMSQIAYSHLNNRNYEYEVTQGYLDNTLFVYLTVDEDDWKVRCDLSNEKALNAVKSDTRNEVEMREMKYENHTAAFDYAYTKLKELGTKEEQMMTFNTSKVTAFQIIKEVVNRLKQLNNEFDDFQYLDFHSADTLTNEDLIGTGETLEDYLDYSEDRKIDF